MSDPGMPRWQRIVAIEGNTTPTWSLVVLLVLTLAAETAGDLIGCVGPAPDYEACYRLCWGNVAAVEPYSCKCHPLTNDDDEEPFVW